MNFRCFNILKKNTIFLKFNSKTFLNSLKNTRGVGNTHDNSSINKINLKAEFQDMLNETKISDEELKKKRAFEENKQKESMAKANSKWDMKGDNLKAEFEKERKVENQNDNENNENQSNINLNLKENDSQPENSEKITENQESTSASSDKEHNTDKNTDKDNYTDKNTDNDNDNYSDKNSNTNNDNDEKSTSSTNQNPSTLSRFFTSFTNVWKQTFPGEENYDLLLEKRKIEAQLLKSKIKEATEDEIAEIEASIPEWKRGALVLVESEAPQEKQSIFEFAKRNVSHHVKNLHIYKQTQQNLKDSELSLLLDDFQKSYSNVRENIRESQNPLFVVSRDLIDRVPFKSSSSQAIRIMRKYDPEFELVTFEKEVDAIFKQTMKAFFEDDLDMVKLVTSETALAVLSSEIKARRERKVEYKHKDFLYQEKSDYVAANVLDEDNVVLRYRIVVQEVNCKISQKDGTVVEGDEALLMNIHYMIDITRNPEPIVEEVGHPYMIVGLERVGVTKQVL